MTTSNHRYVQYRLEELAHADYESAEDQGKQAVTIRLSPALVRLADAIGSRLEQNRQSILSAVIANGLHDMAQAYADAHGDRAQEVYRELMEMKDRQKDDLQ